MAEVNVFNVSFYNPNDVPADMEIIPMEDGHSYDDEVIIEQEMMGDIEEVFITGRIISHPDNIPNKAILISSQYGKKDVDLSEITNQFIFHQQVVNLEGVNVGNVIKAKRLVRADAPPLSYVDNSIQFGDNRRIVIASGPFNQDDLYPKRLHHVVDKAVERNAKLIVLFGPLFVFTEEMSRTENTLDACFESFLDILSNLVFKKDIRVVLVPPADGDLCSFDPMYPNKPYSVNRTESNIYFLPNPCVFSCQGLTIAVNNYDTMLSLAKTQFISKPNDCKLQDYLSCVLNEGYIVPTQAAEEELVKSKFLNMPHIVISTSKLQRFATKCSNTFYVNFKNNKVDSGICVINCNIEKQNEESGLLKIDGTFIDK